MNRRPGPLNFALHKGTEPGPKAANPPRSCRNTAGRLRHRRLALPCPTPTLRAAIVLSSPRRRDRPVSDAEEGRSPLLTPPDFDIGAANLRSPA